ncbi:MAG: cobalamin biosynthesis protein CobG [Novosphingobium sp.]|nr:cobalamin biosynthesis protein CobG [Novosphingobium sp.]
MMAGDGLILRVKPRHARLLRGEVELLCDLATRFGNGAIDLTNRANLQIRGLREADVAQALALLVQQGLVEAAPDGERRRNVLVAPDWSEGDTTWRLADELMARLPELPDLPGKIGFAIDLGAAPVLTEVSADFRLERAADAALLLRLDGRTAGVPVRADEAVDRMLDLARWFAVSGASAAGRARRFDGPLPAWARGTVHPASPRPPLVPGACLSGATGGRIWGLPFGRTDAPALSRLMAATGAAALRVTPWRALVTEGGNTHAVEGFLTDPADPRLAADACPGAPACPQATVQTRALAERLAPHVSGRLHVSGCAKGCARGRAADVAITGRDGAFDLAFQARAGDPPVLSGLTPERLLAHFGAY